MTQPRLSRFIRDNIEPILQAWEDFARTIEPPALTMSDRKLRDHAHEMLLTFAKDLETRRSDEESASKSMGLGRRGHGETAAEAHAEARLLSGYTVVQLVSEYRALRASVLKLWSEEPGAARADNLADMTRFNEAIDQALAESVARYQHLVKQSQNMFLAILGHDLRNPLGTMVSGASCLMHDKGLDAKYVRMATRMYHSGIRMSKLINDLIDFTRTHLGTGIPVHPTEGDLVIVCQQVVNELRASHPEQRVELRTPAQLKAIFDGDRIAQVVSNIVGNAIQYGGTSSPVNVSVTGDSQLIAISVHNFGPPIPPDTVANIFDPMFRVEHHNEGAEQSNLGIGLYISREIIHAHGGQVSVTSNATEGTTFNVTIPREPVSLS